MNLKVPLNSGTRRREIRWQSLASNRLAGFVEKPFTSKELVKRLRTVLEAPPNTIRDDDE